MILRIAFSALIGTVLAASGAADLTAQEFKIVVNTSNPASTISKEQLSRYFLKQATTWADGQEVVPVDLDPASPTRVLFSAEVHRREVQAVRKYWQRIIFSGQGIPAVELKTDAEVLDFIRSNRGAVGYIAADSPVGEGVKVLEMSSKPQAQKAAENSEG